MNLDEMEKLCGAATPGPWRYSHGDDFDHWELWNDETQVWVVQDDSGVEPRTQDLEFIAASREFVPWAIQRIRKLEAVAEGTRELVEATRWIVIEEDKPHFPGWEKTRAALEALEKE